MGNGNTSPVGWVVHCKGKSANQSWSLLELRWRKPKEKHDTTPHPLSAASCTLFARLGHALRRQHLRPRPGQPPLNGASWPLYPGWSKLSKIQPHCHWKKRFDSPQMVDPCHTANSLQDHHAASCLLLLLFLLFAFFALSFALFVLSLLLMPWRVSPAA